MGAIMAGLSWAISMVNSITNLTLQYPLYSSIIAIIIFGGWYKQNWAKSRTFLYSIRGFLLVDGLFGRGKTRFLTLLCQEARRMGMIVLSNFYNSAENLRWNSVKDLTLLMTDMMKLGEYQNHTTEEIQTMYVSEGKKRLKSKLDSHKMIGKKYPNIPRGGFVTKFLLAGDEIQNIFFNRNSMENFSGDRKGLLKLIHQVRHFNSLVAFALTDRDEVDRKFKRISSHYVSIGESFNGLIIKYNVFISKFDKDGNFETDDTLKLTKVPATHINGYQWNRLVIAPLEKLIRRRLPKFLAKLRVKELGFFSKFNADPDVDIYQAGDLFKYLDQFYLNNPSRKNFGVNY